MPNVVTCSSAQGARVAKALPRPYLENFHYTEQALDDLARMIAQSYWYLKNGEWGTIECCVEQGDYLIRVTVDVECRWRDENEHEWYGIDLGDDDMYDFWIHEGKTWMIDSYDNREYDLPDPDLKQTFFTDGDRDYLGGWDFIPPQKTRFQRGLQV